MPDKAKRAYHEWKLADAQAREVEARLAVAWDDFFAGRSKAPNEELITEVARCRAAANEKLTLAMVSIGTAGSPEPRG